MRINLLSKTMIIIVAFVFMFTIIYAAGIVSHQGTDVKVTYGGSETNAQDAMSAMWNLANNKREALKSTCTYAASTNLVVPEQSPSGTESENGHLGSQIVVTNIGGASSTTVQAVITILDAAISELEKC